MELTKDLILTKFKRYGKLKRYYRIFKNEDLRMYFDSHLYRNLLIEDDMGASLYTFPVGAELERYSDTGVIDMNAGLLSLKATEGDPAALKEGTGETPSATTQLQAVFGAEEWSFVGVFLNVDGGGAATAILDITDGSTAYFRLAVSVANLLTIEHTGEYGLEAQVDHVSDAHDLADGDAVYVFVTVRDGQIMGYINGVLVLDEAYSGFTISPVLFLMGGNLASMSISEPCTVDVGLFAFYSSALDDNEKARYDKMVEEIYPNVEFTS